MVISERTIFRNNLVKERETLSGHELADAGTKIFHHVVTSGWYLESSSIHCFSGVVEKGEIPTEKLLAHIIGSGKKLVMPVVVSSAGKMDHYYVRDLGVLEKGHYGISEPPKIKKNKVELKSIDLVLVPGLAVDRRGNRIGFGGGFYDRFLSQIPGAKTMILMPERFVKDEIPFEEHDIRIQAIVTENGIDYTTGS